MGYFAQGNSGDHAALLEVLTLADALIEEALLQKMSLQRALEHVCPKLVKHLGAKSCVVHTYNENLDLATFALPHSHHKFDEYIAKKSKTHERLDAGKEFVVAQPLDVAGEDFGWAAFVFDGAEILRADFLAAALTVFCEQLDNFLFGIRAAREKQRLTLALGRALEHKVLGQGLSEAVAILAANVAIDKLCVVLSTNEVPTGHLHLQHYDGGTKKLDTLVTGDSPELQALAHAYLDGDTSKLSAYFGFAPGGREELLIHGVKETRLVGKILVSSKHGDFNTYDRDLLAHFAEYICQRIVDFHREYRMLARSFGAQDVDRMMAGGDYRSLYLDPREKNVAMMYADISGFTRLSEQVLIEAAKIGRLIDVWGEQAVNCIWAHGGVFDKMVGDCVIGLFGPPFFEASDGELIARAIRAAKAIRAMTLTISQMPEFAQLANEEVNVSIGVNFGPLFVGTFGPNDNFTGFSSGMNNAARLQGQAHAGEILVMEDSVRILNNAPEFAFGDGRFAKVKNVAHPLYFRPLL